MFTRDDGTISLRELHHEMRGHLNIIISGANILSRRMEASKELTTVLQAILDSGRKAADLLSYFPNDTGDENNRNG
jgi:hypothetical protein